jgi:HEPN domain-containing protein
MTASDQALLLIRKAGQDQAVLERLINDPGINDDTLGFHAQQAAEKLLKALLALGGHPYPRSHNIGLLIDLLAEVGVTLPEELLAVETLTPFATTFRYDDLPLEETLDRQAWPPLIAALHDHVQAAIDARRRAEP